MPNLNPGKQQVRIKIKQARPGRETHGCPEEPEDGRAERAAHEALCGGGVVQEADLQGQLSIRPQVDPLDQLVGGPIHHIQMVSIEACSRARG